MTKLSQALGSTYQQKRSELKIKNFELGGHVFKVRIPLVSETDQMFLRITNPDLDHIQNNYAQMTASFQKFKDQPSDDFHFTEDDVLIGGRSMREAAKNKTMTEVRIVEYIKLLIPEDPDNSLSDITYADIESEWPMSVQIALVEKIGECIAPTYKETRGN